VSNMPNAMRVARRASRRSKRSPSSPRRWSTRSGRAAPAPRRPRASSAISAANASRSRSGSCLLCPKSSRPMRPPARGWGCCATGWGCREACQMGPCSCIGRATSWAAAAQMPTRTRLPGSQRARWGGVNVARAWQNRLCTTGLLTGYWLCLLSGYLPAVGGYRCNRCWGRTAAHLTASTQANPMRPPVHATRPAQSSLPEREATCRRGGARARSRYIWVYSKVRGAPGITRMLPGCASAWNSPSVSIISPYASDTRVMMRAAAALRWKALKPATRSRSRVICRTRSLFRPRARGCALWDPTPDYTMTTLYHIPALLRSQGCTLWHARGRRRGAGRRARGPSRGGGRAPPGEAARAQAAPRAPRRCDKRRPRARARRRRACGRAGRARAPARRPGSA